MAAIAQLHVPDEAAETLARAQRGDQDAFAALIGLNEAMVFSIALRFFDDRSRAEEIAQDVFLQLYRSLRELHSAAHVVFWLRQVTVRRCIDANRRTPLRAVRLEDVAERAAHAQPGDPLFDRRLRRVLSELPEIQRVVVTLRYQEDLDPADIARVVGKPLNTIKSTLQRALQSLRNRLGEP